MSTNILGMVAIELQALAVMLGWMNANYWRHVTIGVLAVRANASERLATQSSEILRYIADDPSLYGYFYENKPLAGEQQERVKVLCCAEIMAHFFEHIVLQRRSLPKTSRDAWMIYVRERYAMSLVVREFIAEHRSWYAGAFLEFIEHSRRTEFEASKSLASIESRTHKESLV